MAQCTLCRKSAVAGSNVSHSQVHTKRKFKANLQKVNGLLLCTRCLKAIDKTKRVEQEAKEQRIKEKEEKKAKEQEDKEEKVNKKDKNK